MYAYQKVVRIENQQKVLFLTRKKNGEHTIFYPDLHPLQACKFIRLKIPAPKKFLVSQNKPKKSAKHKPKAKTQIECIDAILKL